MNQDELMQRAAGQIEITIEILQQHEKQFEQVRNVIIPALASNNLTAVQARKALIDIASILHIAL